MNRLIISVLFLLSLLLSVGCKQRYSNQYTVLISSRFTESDQATILDALDSWKQHLPMILQFKIIITDDVTKEDSVPEDYITIVPTTYEYVQTRKPSGPASAAAVTIILRDGWSGAVYLPMDNAETIDNLGKIVRHEVGHAMGLVHDTGHSVMYPNVGGNAPDMTCRDVAQFCQLHDCIVNDCKD